MSLEAHSMPLCHEAYRGSGTAAYCVHVYVWLTGVFCEVKSLVAHSMPLCHEAYRGSGTAAYCVHVSAWLRGVSVQ
jgi:hypothetical protein